MNKKKTSTRRESNPQPVSANLSFQVSVDTFRAGKRRRHEDSGRLRVRGGLGQRHLSRQVWPHPWSGQTLALFCWLVGKDGRRRKCCQGVCLPSDVMAKITYTLFKQTLWMPKRWCIQFADLPLAIAKHFWKRGRFQGQGLGPKSRWSGALPYSLHWYTVAVRGLPSFNWIPH